MRHDERGFGPGALAGAAGRTDHLNCLCPTADIYYATSQFNRRRTQSGPATVTLEEWAMGMCFNKKVIGGLAVTALVILAVAPRFLGAALPLLFVAVCPLSMVFMMRGMNGGKSCETAKAGDANTTAADAGADQDAQLRELHEEVNLLKAELALRAHKPTASLRRLVPPAADHGGTPRQPEQLAAANETLRRVGSIGPSPGSIIRGGPETPNPATQ